VLNAGTVAIGVLAMTYFSLLKLQGPVTFSLIFLDSTFPDIVILLAKLPVAHAILLSVRPHGSFQEERGCRK
jgi:hypothetical protein